MRAVYMGTPAFAADILRDIHESVDIVSVYTKEDAVRSRGGKKEPTPVKVVATDLDLSVRCPKTLRSDEEIEHLRSLEPEIIIVAAYGMILPPEVLEIPRFGCINVHASLLPRWRGAAPIERAILAGDEFAGVCIMRMEEGLDTGDYCVRRQIPIEKMTSSELTQELASLGSQALLTALSQIEDGAAKWTKQDEALATYADKITKSEMLLNPSMTCDEVERRVRIQNRAHPARCKIAGKDAALIKVSTPDEAVLGSVGDLPAGNCAFKSKRLYIGCKDGPLQIDLIKPAGKSQMEGRSFAQGSQPILQGNATWTEL